MIGLEYLLLFGVPENKVEILDGRTRLCLAFPDRDEACRHFDHWLEQLKIWQGAAQRSLRPEGKRARVGRFELTRRECVLELLVPLSCDLLFNSRELEYHWKLWSNNDGVEPAIDRFHLWRQLEEGTGRCFSSTELLLTPDSMVAPIAYTFPPGLHLPKGSPEGPRGLVGQHYYQGVPDLVVEELRPIQEPLLRGEKLDLYRRAGLPELWLLHSGRRQIEVWRDMQPIGKFGPGDCFEAFGRLLDPASILPEPPRRQPDLEPEGPEGAGLQQFLVAGSPACTFEFYGGIARRFLACPSQLQAERVEQQVCQELSRWQNHGFTLHRQGQVLRLDVKIGPAIHRKFFGYWHFTGNWD